MPSGEGGPARR